MAGQNAEIFREADIEAVVEIHQSVFADYPTTRLGPQFLRIFYRELGRSGGSISFVHRSADGSVDGFVCGITDYRRFYADLVRRNLLSLPSALIARAVRYPALLSGIAKRGMAVFRILKPGRARQAAPAVPALAFLNGERYAYLLSIAVAPRARGTGVGHRLIEALAADFKHRGYRYCLLDTDSGNAPANGLFLRSGFRLATSYSLFDKTRFGNVYARDLR